MRPMNTKNVYLILAWWVVGCIFIKILKLWGLKV